jgi:hypothetical protein
MLFSLPMLSFHIEAQIDAVTKAMWDTPQQISAVEETKSSHNTVIFLYLSADVLASKLRHLDK